MRRKAFIILAFALLAVNGTTHADGLALAEGTLDSITVDTLILRHRDGSRLAIQRSELTASESERMSESVGRYVFVHAPFSAIRALPKKKRLPPLKHDPRSSPKKEGWSAD